MSHRNDPRTLPERLAALEEQMRSLSSVVVVTGSGGLSAALFAAKGDLLAGAAPGQAGRLQAGADGSVLTANAGAPLGLTWQAPASDAALLAVLMDNE